MTTIAFDGTTFAADSRMSGSYIDSKKCRKLFRVRTFGRNLVVAFAGDVSLGVTFVERIKKNADLSTLKPLPKDDSFAALVYDSRAAKLYHFTWNCVPVEVGIPSAIGSGSDFAMGAMHAHATARLAVTIACKLDGNSSPPIHVLEVDV